MVNWLYTIDNLWQSLVNNSKSYKYRHYTVIWIIVHMGQTQHEINIYSSKMIIVRWHFSYDASTHHIENYRNWNLEKNSHVFKENKRPMNCFRSDQISVWAKKQPHMGNQLPHVHVLAFKDKGDEKISNAAHNKLIKTLPKHTCCRLNLGSG